MEILRNFAYLSGKLSINVNFQTQLCELGIETHIMKGLKQFPEDVVLSSNSCFALASMVFNNMRNAENILKTDIIGFTHFLVKEYSRQHVLISNICILYNSLS